MRRHRGDGFVRRATISFRLLYGLLIMGTADDKFCGLASQLTHCRMDRKSGHGSMRLGTGSRYLIRDRDGLW